MKGLKHGQVSSTDINRLLPTDGTPVNAVAAIGILTVDTQATANDTMTIGTTTYTFKAGATAVAGQIGIGADVAACKLAIVAAINGTDALNAAHPLVSASAFSTNDCTLTARTKGLAGSSIPLTETLTAVTNIFDRATMGLTVEGVDGTAGVAGEQLIDTSYIYVCLADQNHTGANWKKIALNTL